MCLLLIPQLIPPDQILSSFSPVFGLDYILTLLDLAFCVLLSR